MRRRRRKMLANRMKNIVRASLKRILHSLNNLPGYICEKEIRISVLFFIIVIIIVLIITPNLNSIYISNTISASFGLLFNLLLFGIFISIIKNLGEARRNIKRWQEEIDDYKGWDEKIAKIRIISIIKRANNKRRTKLDLSFCILNDSNLTGLDLRRSNLIGTKFNNSNLSQINLSYANLVAAQFSEAELRNADLSFSLIEEASFSKAKMHSINLESARNRGEDGTSFFGAIITYANLKNIKLAEANFSKSDLTGTHLDNSFLRMCFFRNANFSYASLKEAKLTGSIFKNALFNKANLENCSFASYYEELSHGEIHLITDLEGASFKDTSLKGVDWKEAILTNAEFIDCDLTESINLTFDQLESVKTLSGSKLDKHLAEQIKLANLKI